MLSLKRTPNSSRHDRFTTSLRRMIGPGQSERTNKSTTLYFESGQEAFEEVFTKLAARFGKPKRMNYLYKFYNREAETILYLSRWTIHSTKNFIAVER